MRLKARSGREEVRGEAMGELGKRKGGEERIGEPGCDHLSLAKLREISLHVRTQSRWRKRRKGIPEEKSEKRKRVIKNHWRADNKKEESRSLWGAPNQDSLNTRNPGPGWGEGEGENLLMDRKKDLERKRMRIGEKPHCGAQKKRRSKSKNLGWTPNR